MATREEKEQQLRAELKKCLILSDEDRKFWSDHASALPNQVLDNILKIVKEKNSVIEEYMEAALKEDSDHKYLANLKAKILEIKNKAFDLEEGSEHETAEEILKKNLTEL